MEVNVSTLDYVGGTRTFTKEDIIAILLTRASAELHCWPAALKFVETLPDGLTVSFTRCRETQNFLENHFYDYKKNAQNPDGNIENLERL